MSFNSSEWISLQHHVNSTAANIPKEHNLDTCSRMFMNSSVKGEGKNNIDVIEILIYSPFTNAKTERRFSRIAHVESDFKSRSPVSMLPDK